MFIVELFTVARRWKLTQLSIKKINGQTQCGGYIQWSIIQSQTRWISDACYNLDEPRKHCVCEIHIRGQMLYDFTLIRTDKLSHRQKGDFKLLGVEGRGDGGWTDMWVKRFCLGWWKALEIDGGDDCSTLVNGIHSGQWIVHQKWLR